MRKYSLFIVILILSHISYGQNAADIDTSFSTGIGFTGGVLGVPVRSIVVQKDGKILVGGSFTSYNGVAADGIIRLNNNGSIDASFVHKKSEFYNVKIESVVLQSDGKILMIGSFNISPTLVVNCIRINSDGSLDTTIARVGSSERIKTLSLQSDGKIILGGLFKISPDGLKSIVRLGLVNSFDIDKSFLGGNGFIDNGGFDSPGEVSSIVIQPDGKILVGGKFANYNGTFVNNMTRLNSDGSLDNSFLLNKSVGFDNGGWVNSIVLQPDGKILLSGSFTSYNGLNFKSSGASSISYVRLNNDGSLDKNFIYPSISSTFSSSNISLQTDGKILVLGTYVYSIQPFTGVKTYALGVVRLNSDGTKDQSFLLGVGFKSPGSELSDLEVINIQKDGKILVGGKFKSYNDIVTNQIVRLQGSTVLSTNNFDKNDFAIYPNPVKDIININLQGRNTSLEYVIYDMSGKKITSNKLLENKIDVSSLSKGIYILKIKTGEKIFENKFIKQ